MTVGEAVRAQPLSWRAVVIVVAALAGITMLGALDKVSSDAVVAIYSLVIGGGLGHANGYRQGRANGPAVS